MSTWSNSTTCIVPYGGPPDYLDEAVDSALRQGFAEIVLVNDCRPQSELESVSSRPSVRILDLEVRSGPAHARNAGVKACNTPFLVFLDADDILCPGYLSAMQPFVRGQGLRCAAGALRYIGRRSTRVGARLSTDPGFALPSGFFAQRSLIQEAGYFPISIAEDELLFHEVRRLTPLLVCPEAKVLYRIHARSSSSQKTKAMWAFDRLLPLYYGGEVSLEQANRIANEFAQSSTAPAGLESILPGSVGAEAKFLARTAYGYWLDRDVRQLTKTLVRLPRYTPQVLSLAARKWFGVTTTAIRP